MVRRSPVDGAGHPTGIVGGAFDALRASAARRTAEATRNAGQALRRMAADGRHLTMQHRQVVLGSALNSTCRPVVLPAARVRSMTASEVSRRAGRQARAWWSRTSVAASTATWVRLVIPSFGSR